jgi:hypothetical protein
MSLTKPQQRSARSSRIIQPTVILGPFDHSECSEQVDPFSYTINGSFQERFLPFVNCDVTGAADGAIKVRAGAGAFLAGPGTIVVGNDEPLRDGSAIGRIGKSIHIPDLESDEVASPVLTAQISTEIAWNGLLWNRRVSIPSWAQVVGTLQVRDMETGLVVASNTFLNERADLDNVLPTNFGDFAFFAYGWTSVRNSSGVDVTAQLLRGREYRVEVEAKCEDVSVLFPTTFDFFGPNGPDIAGLLWSGGGCFFTDNAAVSDVPSAGGAPGDTLNLTLPTGVFFGNHMRYNVRGGFNVAPLTVTVQDDGKAKVAEIVNQDDDGDGLPNSIDECPQSNLAATVIIDGCDSNIVNTVFGSGCSISDEIEKCALEAGNHGAFESCVADLINGLDLLDIDGGPGNVGAIQNCAAIADIP